MKLSLKDIKEGMTIFIACSEQKWVSEYIVYSMPFQKLGCGVDSYWIVAIAPTCTPKFTPHTFDIYSKSTQDAGIEPNTYNKHLTFDNRQEAEIYAGIAVCKCCGQKIR